MTLDELPVQVHDFRRQCSSSCTPVEARSTTTGAFATAARATSRRLSSRSTSTSSRPRATDERLRPAAELRRLPGGTNRSRSRGGRAAFAEQGPECPERRVPSGVIVFNQGNTPDREGPASSERSSRRSTQATHPRRRAQASPTARHSPGRLARRLVQRPASSETRTDCERHRRAARRQRLTNVVMAGAHLDSVTGGSRDQRQRLRLGRDPRDRADDGQGQAGEHHPLRLVGCRGAGSRRLDGLRRRACRQAELDRIALYLNYDMVGSPNYVFMVYDGDKLRRLGAPAGPPGSTAIEDRVRVVLHVQSASPYDELRVLGRSDYEAFIDARTFLRVASSRAPKASRPPRKQRSGAARRAQQFDPCYHHRLRHVRNVNEHALEVRQRPDRVRDSSTFAYSTDAVGQRRAGPSPGNGARAGSLPVPGRRRATPSTALARRDGPCGLGPLPSVCLRMVGICRMFRDHRPLSDYELDDVLVVEDPKQLRALADALRARIVGLLRERAASTTELAAALGDAEGNGRPPREGSGGGRASFASFARARCARSRRATTGASPGSSS